MGDLAALFDMLSWSWEQLRARLPPDGYQDDASCMREVVEGLREVIPLAVEELRAGRLTLSDAADILECYRWVEGLMCCAPTNTPQAFASDSGWNAVRRKAAAIAAHLAPEGDG
jgi:hypothetical protein